MSCRHLMLRTNWQTLTSGEPRTIFSASSVPCDCGEIETVQWEKLVNKRLMLQDKQVYFCRSADVQSERPSSRLEQNMLNVRRKCCHSRGAADTSCQRNMSSKYSSNSSSLDRCYKENHRNVSSCHVTPAVKCFVCVASNSGSVSAKLLRFFFFLKATCCSKQNDVQTLVQNTKKQMAASSKKKNDGAEMPLLYWTECDKWFNI